MTVDSLDDALAFVVIREASEARHVLMPRSAAVPTVVLERMK